jgi:hypothetical protein
MSVRIPYGVSAVEPEPSKPKPKPSAKQGGHIYFCYRCNRGRIHRTYLVDETHLRQECTVCGDYSDYVRHVDAWWPDALADAADEWVAKEYATEWNLIRREQRAAERTKSRPAPEPEERRHPPVVTDWQRAQAWKKIVGSCRTMDDALRLAHGNEALASKILWQAERARYNAPALEAISHEKQTLDGVDDL